MKRNYLEASFREVARREGVLLRYLDNEPDIVRLVTTHVGKALATYELADEKAETA